MGQATSGTDTTTAAPEPAQTAPDPTPRTEGTTERTGAFVPSVGRDVHQVGRGSADGHYAPEIRPGKILHVEPDGVVDLVIWTREGEFWPKQVPYHGGDAAEEPPFAPYYRCPHTGLAYPGGTWHWPPTVGPRR